MGCEGGYFRIVIFIIREEKCRRTGGKTGGFRLQLCIKREREY